MFEGLIRLRTQNWTWYCLSPYTVSKRISPYWKSTVRDPDDWWQRKNCNSKTISVWVRQNVTARSPIGLWRADYQHRGTHTHRGGSGRSQMSSQTKNGIRPLFENNLRMSLRASAAETSVAHVTYWNFLWKELGGLPCKLQIASSLTEDRKVRRNRFAQYFLRKLRNDPRCLKRIVSSDEDKFSLSGSASEQNCRIWASERPNEIF